MHPKGMKSITNRESFYPIFNGIFRIFSDSIDTLLKNIAYVDRVALVRKTLVL